MEHLISSLLIISLIATGIFAFMFFNHDTSNQSGDCIATIIGGTICPTNIVSFVQHHISAFQTFFNISISTAFNIFIFLLTILLFARIFVFVDKNLFCLKADFFLQCLRDALFNNQLTRIRLISWLSLFEHSPSI